MLIEYSNIYTPQNLIEIENISNCAIEGVNDDSLYFYFICITVRGISTITTYGPLVPDLLELPSGYTCELYNINYNPKKLKQIIYSWLNSKKPGKAKPISSAKIICIEEALSQFRDINEYFHKQPDLALRLSSASEE